MNLETVVNQDGTLTTTCTVSGKADFDAHETELMAVMDTLADRIEDSAVISVTFIVTRFPNEKRDPAPVAKPPA